MCLVLPEAPNLCLVASTGADFFVHDVINSKGMLKVCVPPCTWYLAVHLQVHQSISTTRCSTSRTQDSSSFALRTIAAAGGLSYVVHYAIADPHPAGLGLRDGIICTRALPGTVVRNRSTAAAAAAALTPYVVGTDHADLCFLSSFCGSARHTDTFLSALVYQSVRAVSPTPTNRACCEVDTLPRNVYCRALRLLYK